MVNMDWYKQAKDKLEREAKAGNYDKYGSAMKTAVCEALLNFADQDSEFAQAIVQGGSFTDCMKTVTKGIGSSISDLEVYKKAVSFYFPGADIEMQMIIKLIPGEVNRKSNNEGLILDLNAFL